MLTKSKLAILLSQLKGFSSPNVSAEQYMLEAEVAADILWNAYMKGDLEGRVSTDLGCGTGILGIGALLLGAKKVWFLDKSEASLEVLRQNLAEIGQKVSVDLMEKSEIIYSDVNLFNKEVDLVIMNPPFGTKVRHADRVFLAKSMEVDAKVIYSVHKLTSKRFIDAFSRDNGYKVSEIMPYKLLLKQTMPWHKRKRHYIEVGCWRIVKNS